MPLEKLSWKCPTLECHWRNSNFCSLHWNTTGGTVTAHTRPALIVKQISIHASLKWQDGGTSSKKWTGLCKLSLYLELTALQWIPVLLLTHMWVLQHHSEHAFDMSTIIVFVYWGLQVKWNQFSSNNSHHTSCMHKGLHVGKWPDLMTFKPDSVSTLEYHWTDHTRRPLEP